MSKSYPRTLLAKALRAKNKGTKQFVYQSLSALILIPLVIWFCLSLAFLPNANYTSVVAWLSSPLNAILIIITLLIGLYHGALGIESILEDYVSSPNTQKSAIMATKLLLFFFAILGVASVLKIVFTA